MASFFKTLFFFLLLFLIFDKLFYPFLLISPDLEADRRLDYIINGKMKKDLLIFGSSRGARNIIAGQIEDSIHISAYNLSYPGSNIEFHEFLLRTLIHFNEIPKFALLAVDEEEFTPRESINFRLDRLYPLSKYDYINEELISRGQKTFLSKILVLERINKRNFDIRKKQFSALDTIISCGSMPISFQSPKWKYNFNDKLRQYDQATEQVDKIKAFEKFVNLCSENGIQLIVVFSPNFRPYNDRLENRVRELVDSKVNFYLYDTLNSIYKDSFYYFDNSHLKKNGSEIFTNEIIDYLKTGHL